MKCIYCLSDKPETDFKKREHVIPQCFGVFPENNLVLHKMACDQCNQYFGDKIELYMGRDSYEGFTRMEHGIQSKGVLKNRRRFKSKIIDSEQKGAIVREKYLGEDGQIKVSRVPQVGFFNGIRQEYVYFKMGEIPNKDELLKKGYVIKNEIVWIIGDDEEYLKLVGELKDKGIDLKPDPIIIKKGEKASALIESTITLDKTIMRGLCKIAFNYLCSQVGSRFVLMRDFNPIRKFIRYGDGDPKDFLLVNQPPILFDDQLIEKFGAKTTRGHLIILSWRKGNLFSKLSLFNDFTYGINLCENFKGIWIPVKIGHHFDLDNKEITKLQSVSKKFLP